MDIKEFKALLFEKAKAAGFTDYEMYFGSSVSFMARAFKGELTEYKNAGEQGIAFRGTINGRMANASAEKLEADAVDFLIKTAMENAGILESKEKETLFGGSKEYGKVKTFYPEIEDISVADKIDALKKFEKAITNADPRVKQADYCTVVSGRDATAISNSLGLDVSKEQNQMIIYGMVHVNDESNGSVKTNMDFWRGTKLSDFNPEALAKTIVDKAIAQLGAASIPSGKYPVIFENEAMGSLLSVYSSVFNAERVLKGFSMLKDKIGEKIASEVIELRDDALVEEYPDPTPFDSEGVATKNKAVIENGVLKTYLHNLKTAAAMNAEPTGNGFKQGFAAPVGISITNFYIKPSDKPFDELLKQMGSGLLICDMSGLHSGANQVSGDFSLIASGFMVEDGKIGKPVEQITIAGNFYELIKNAAAVASDLKFVSTSSIGSPSVYVPQIDVSGL